MKLYIENKELEYENNILSIDTIMEDIYSILKDESKVLDHLNVDGEKVYVDFGEYLFNNIENIEIIEVEALSIIELINNTLLTTLDYIEQSVKPLKLLTKEIDYNEISNLIEGLSWIFETFIYIDKDPNLSNKIERRKEWNVYAKNISELSSILKNIVVSMQLREEDNLKLIISDELIPLFEDMKGSIIDLIEVK